MLPMTVFLLRMTVFCGALLLGRGNACAGTGEDCTQHEDLDLSIRACSILIQKDPRHAAAYVNRGSAYVDKGEYERAIADLTTAIEIDPKIAPAYYNRGQAYNKKGEYERAIADFTSAIEIDPKDAETYYSRGLGYYFVHHYDSAIADVTTAIEINPKNAEAYNFRGVVYQSKGEYDRSLADLTKAIQLDPINVQSLGNRAKTYEARGEPDKAIEDYNRALALPAHSARAKKQQSDASEASKRLAALKIASVPTVSPPISALPMSGPRLALLIGNSAYQNAERLINPTNDARAIAASFRRLGFADVVELYDADLSAMTAAIKDFGDRAANADWAVVYYAGHGMEMNGVDYLIPVDAKLERDTHVSDETVALTQVLEKVESARKFRLVILDACRNNPFVKRMIRSVGVTRSVGRGLAPIEPEGGVLVAYAAKHGTTADDGSGANSPFAAAMLANVEEPGLEINFLFRRVRDQVLATTHGRQEPFLYGSLPSESLFFKVAAPR
jgi:tetratricopeptide (TPR) repeat protein